MHATEQIRMREVIALFLQRESDAVTCVRELTRLVPIDSPLRKSAPFLGIIGIESETDIFPMGRVRDEWALDALKQMDAERIRYEEQIRDTLEQDCKEILEALNQQKEYS